MKSKLVVAITSVLATGIGYIISNPLMFHICATPYQFNGYTGCLDSSIKSIGSPLLIFALFFLPLAIILIFVPRTVFKSWLRFAVWALPLAFIYIALTPVTSHGFMDFFPFYRDDAARLASEIFSVVSLILIIWKWFSLRRSAKP